MTVLSRRHVLAGAAAVGALAALPRASSAQAPKLLRATTRTLDIDGRAASVWGLLDAQGRPGLTLEPGERFAVELANELPEPTLIHWHGQLPPNAQDGVPDMPAGMLEPGGRRGYDFAAEPGTHWMHAHVPLHELRLLAAPLVVREAASDRQEVVIFLHDFTFSEPAEVMTQIGAGAGGMDHAAMGHGAMGHGSGGMADGGMTGMDVNDFEFDAYLANDRTLNDPEVVSVERGGKVRLRVINGAAMTGWWIDLGALSGRLVAVDGRPVAPVPGSRFPLSMGQRADVELDLPAEGAFPVLALREGARQRAGIVLATPGASVGRIEVEGDAEAPPLDLAAELQLRAAAPLPEANASVQRMLMLEGSMSPYRWTIDGRSWGDHLPVEAASGQRVEMMMHNMSMMSHPMHLHGHVFQVVAVNGQRFAGAVRDTVLVPPMAAVTIAVDAGEPARWMFHCHHMAHLQTGMMTEFRVG